MLRLNPLTLVQMAMVVLDRFEKVSLLLLLSVLWIHLILMRMRIRILDPHCKIIDPDPSHFFKIYWIFLLLNFFNKKMFKFLLNIFSLIFILKLNEPFRHEEIFIISLFFKSSVKKFFLQFLVDVYPLDLHIFADPDPDTGPKHWLL